MLISHIKLNHSAFSRQQSDNLGKWTEYLSHPLILPLISIMRSGIEQDPDGYGISPNTSEIVIKKKISRANLEYKRAINENNLQSQDYVLSGSAVGNRFSTRNHTPASGSPSLSKSTKNIYEKSHVLKKT